MVEQTPEEIERLLEAGAWLKAGQLAALFGVDESTIHRWFKQGRLPYRRVGGDGQREADPEAVKLRLRAARHVHGGD